MRTCGKCGGPVDGPCPVCEAQELDRLLKKYPNVSMGCAVPKVVCPTCKKEVRPTDIASTVGACIFCGEDHAYHECPEYPEQWAEAMREARELEGKE